MFIFFDSEMDERFSEMESGKTKKLSLEEVETEARFYNKNVKEKR